MNLKQNIILLALTLASFNLISQSAISPAGGKLIGTNGSANSTIGQIVYSTNIGTTGSEIQGINQPKTSQIPTNVREKKLELHLYPNPTSDNITIPTNLQTQDTYCYLVVDLQGNTVKKGNIKSLKTVVNLTNLPSSLYLIKITDLNRTIKTYKITKR